ncbi:MAG TPA: response regulator [Halalkalibaculum sp.]|nr:response regulator [Halalkalibaculum sp.]
MKRKVLIVEDECLLRLVIKRTLMKCTLDIEEIYEAGNGTEGLECLEKCAVDLILTDINMPVMDGITMLNHIYANPLFKEIPIVVISAINDQQRIEEFSGRGLGFLSKPFTLQQLEEEIYKLDKVTNEYGLLG